MEPDRNDLSGRARGRPAQLRWRRRSLAAGRPRLRRSIQATFGIQIRMTALAGNPATRCAWRTNWPADPAGARTPV